MTPLRIKWIISQIVALACGWMVGGSWGFVVLVALLLLADIRVAVEEINHRGESQ